MAASKPSQPPPTYNETMHGETSHGSAPVPSGEQGSVLRGPDMTYLKSVGGILKIVEAVSCLIGFIIDMTAYYPGGGFTSFSTINGFLQAVIWFVLRLLHAIPQIIANYYIELIMCSILLLFLFISFIISAVHGWMDGAIAAVCFFCFVATAAYGVDVFLQVREIRSKFTPHRSSSDDDH